MNDPQTEGHMASHIGRRKFLATLLGGAGAWPVVARAQQAERAKRVGVLMGRAANDLEGQRQAAALREGLAAMGWVSGHNLAIDYRWHAGEAGQAQVLAKELSELRPDVLVANTTPSLAALRQQTGTIPIVFIGVADPVGQGFVPNLAHPGSNITGFGLEEPSMGAKWVELLKEMKPTATRSTILFNPETAPFARLFLPSIEMAANAAALSFRVVHIKDDADIEHAITVAGREQAGLIVLPDAFLFGRRTRIIKLAEQQKVPGVYAYRAFAADGGLLAYGIDRVELFRAAASYIDRALKGERAADLPVQHPTKFELVINLKAAKALGLDVPDTLL